MGAPTSGLLTEFFLQHLEHLHISHLSDKYKIIKYFRYVDDVLVIYDTNHTDIQNMSRDFNTLHLRLKFTAGCKTDNQINFLDVTIHRTPTNWRIAMYRKPTFTDTDIPYTCNLQEDEYNTEVTTIQNIPYNNAFAIHHENPPTLKPPPNITREQTMTTTHTHIHSPTQKWATFTYNGKETTFITNLFKMPNIKTAFRTNNTA